jgi:SAM-dependent methyltransferase
MGIWNDRVMPHLVDVVLRDPGIGDLRARVCAGLRGQVLEIGFGSGLNVRFYPSEVTGVSAVEPSDVAWRLSEPRRRGSDVPVRRSGLDGQHLAEADASHDAALVTFSLCTIEDPALALREVRRVVRPGGRLHFLEHGLAPEARTQRWQRRLDPVERRVAGGCHLTRDVPALLAGEGWTTAGSGWLEQAYLPGPAVGRPWTYLSLGVATST